MQLACKGGLAEKQKGGPATVVTIEGMALTLYHITGMARADQQGVNRLGCHLGYHPQSQPTIVHDKNIELKKGSRIN